MIVQRGIEGSSPRALACGAGGRDCLPAAAAILFAVMGWGEEGASGAALFILLLVICVVQWVRPLS
jgi:hypothetical protein